MEVCPISPGRGAPAPSVVLHCNAVEQQETKWNGVSNGAGHCGFSVVHFLLARTPPMIYLAYLLLRYAFLVALVFGIMLGAVFAFRAARRAHRALAGVLLASFVAPVLWLLYGWITFTASCDRTLPLQQLQTIERQDTVMLQLKPGHGFMKDMNIDIGSLLEVVGPVCTEYELWRPITDPQTNEARTFARDCVQNRRRVDYQRSNRPRSKYVIHVEARQREGGIKGCESVA
jgi:hypothetical protein